jgi:hypothetical protein
MHIYVVLSGPIIIIVIVRRRALPGNFSRQLYIIESVLDLFALIKALKRPKLLLRSIAFIRSINRLKNFRKPIWQLYHYAVIISSI